MPRSGSAPASSDWPTVDIGSRSDDLIHRDSAAPIIINSAGSAAVSGFTAPETIFLPLPADGQPQERPAKAVPRRIGNYEIISVLGRGGMGVVYKARHLTLDRIVALKMILAAELASQRELARFLDEARVVAQFNHDRVVKIYDFGEDQGNPYFSMVHVDGGTLQGLLRRGPLEPRRAALMIRQVAEAVAYAHDRGVVHRDLKPSNILLDEAGGPIVSDFGLAKRSGSSDGHTIDGQVLGTPSYMPPEQARGDVAGTGHHSDVYSTGALLYHAVCGRPPFQAATSVETLRQVIDDEPVPPRQLNRAVDHDLETIVLKCLEKDPARRYASEAALAADLAAYCDGRPIEARPVPALERAWKWSRRHPALASLCGATAAALVGFGIAGFYRAEAATQRARLAEIEMRDRAEAAEARDGLFRAVDRSRSLLDADKPQEARLAIAAALARVDGERGLERERARATEALAEIDARLAADAERAQRERRSADFRRHRDAALFHGLQSFGLDPRLNQERAAAEADEALALVGLDGAGAQAPVAGTQAPVAGTQAPVAGTQASTAAAIDPVLVGDEAEARPQYHELLLVRADARLRAAAGGPSPEDVARSLADVDRAAAVLGRETQAGRLQRAACLEAAGDIAAARRERRTAEELGPLDVASDHFLIGKQIIGRPAASAADLVRASDAFERALLLNPSHFWAQYGLGSVELRRGRPDLAEVHLTACIGRRPDLAWAWVLRGAARAALGEHALAEEDLARAVKLAPGDEAAHVALQQRGLIAFARGDAEASRGLLRQAAAVAPDAFQPLLSLATVEARAGNADEAIRLLDEAGRRAPRLPLVPRERARLHAEQRDFAAAERDCRAAVRLEEADPAARADDLCLLGEAIFRQGRIAEAIRVWNMAIEIDADHPKAHLWRGVALVELQQHAAALESFEACLRKGRPTLELYVTRAACRATLGDYAAAIDDYSRAIEMAPTARVYSQRGWLYALRGNPLFGLQDFEKALEIDPRNADAHCGRGLTLAFLGRHAEAAAAAEKALDLGETGFRHAFKVATVFAVASPRVVLSARERKEQGPTAGQLRVKYLTRACDLVERALSHEAVGEHDDLWLAHVESDPHFQPLLTEPEFRRLKARVMAGDTEGRDAADRAARGGAGGMASGAVGAGAPAAAPDAAGAAEGEGSTQVTATGGRP